MPTLQQLMTSCDPNPESLLEALSPLMTDDDLVELAKANYEMDVDKHLGALRRALSTGTAFFPTTRERYYGYKVCQLWIFRPFEDDSFAPIHNGRRDQAASDRRRAFACSYVLRADYDNVAGTGPNCPGDTAGPLVASCLRLGGDVISAARRSVAAMAAADWCPPSDRVLFGAAVLLLALREEPVQHSPLHIAELATELLEHRVEDEQCLARRCAYPPWRSLAHHVLIHPQRPHPAAGDAALRGVGRMIAASSRD